MEYIENKELRDELLGRLIKKFEVDRSDVPHVTELTNCLTKSYLDRVEPIEHDDQTLIGFMVGFALEQVLLRDEGQGAPPVEEFEGIFLSKDYVDLYGETLDLKSTRMFPGDDGTPKTGWPEGWMSQFMAYLRPRLEGNEDERIPFGVAVVYIVARRLEVGTLVFGRQEIYDQWDWLLMRRAIYMKALASGEAPTPFKHNRDWECGAYGGCPRKDTCDAIVRGEE